MRGTCISTTGVSSCLRKMGLATSNFAFGTFGTAMSRPSKRGLMKLIPVASVAGAEWQLCWRPRAIGGPAGQETSLLPADAVAGSSTWWSASNRPPMAQGPLAASSGNTLRRSAIPFTWGQADLAPAGRRHMSAGAGGSASESEASSPGAGDEAASSLGLAAADTVQFGVADSDMVIEVASSTMWSRFYSGSPDFWVNIHYAQELLAYAHDVTGLPWWASIMAVTLGTRVLIFPVFVYQQKVAGRLATAVPLLQEVELEYYKAKEVYKDPAAGTRRANKMRKIYKEHACHPWRLGVNMLAIGPAFMSFFFGIKAMTASYPSIASGGVLWFPDLSVPDPYVALPIVASFTFLGIMELALRGRQAAMQPMQYKMQRGVQRIVCLSMAPLLIGLQYPAGVFIYWITNNSFSMLQVVAFNQPSIRKFFGLDPIPTAPPSGSREEFERMRHKILEVAKAPQLNIPKKERQPQQDDSPEKNSPNKQ